MLLPFKSNLPLSYWIRRLGNVREVLPNLSKFCRCDTYICKERFGLYHYISGRDEEVGGIKGLPGVDRMARHFEAMLEVPRNRYFSIKYG